MITKLLSKPVYIGLAIVGLLYWRHHNDIAHSGVTRTQEAHPDDGSNPLADMWGMLNGLGQSSPNFHNVTPGANAAVTPIEAATLPPANPNSIWDGGAGAPGGIISYADAVRLGYTVAR